ncbi:hypothetical protein B296_00038119, partial [Ensete ventricosum]
LVFFAPSRKFKIVFCLSSQKFKIQVIPIVFALRKSYEQIIVKKCDGNKLYAKSRTKSSFDRFFMHRFENSKCWPFPMY